LAACLCSCSDLGSTPINKPLQGPRAFEGKTVTISGRVQERVALLVIQYFTVRDATGEINVTTTGALPAVGSSVRVKGRIQQAFAIGDQQIIVFVEQDVPR
jgi:hypothetical protein